MSDSSQDKTTSVISGCNDSTLAVDEKALLEQLKNNIPVSKQRSLPIPKEVNQFVLANYGALYYKSHDCLEKLKILKMIEKRLKLAGYEISCENLERRLKNMKSHYRRKKSDIERGIVSCVEWEYFQTLDKIFNELPKPTEKRAEKRKNETESDQKEKVVTIITSTPMSSQASGNCFEEEAEDLTITKKPRIIAFNNACEIKEQIPINPKNVPKCEDNVDENNAANRSILNNYLVNYVQEQQPASNAAPNAPIDEPDEDMSSQESNTAAVFQESIREAQLTIRRLVENIKKIDEQRLSLDQQRINLEIRRYEIDLMGYQLTELLFKIANPTPLSDGNKTV
ncbi:CLUMA_CG009964, isoform A [Clunio marinus]|uniref:CLUMA_CG009964, isoform A n=1 Tax=Clunio marinus TaxID=568069 RepID=A0A1J1I904_9DIPT|nr:CLUMA_CG009964, isoform A [Clunio marinus]